MPIYPLLITTSPVSKPTPTMLTTLTLSLVCLLAVTFVGCNTAQTGDIVATVNGRPIMRAELDKIYQDRLGDVGPHDAVSKEQADSMRLQLLSQLITGEIIEQHAAKINLTATPAEVDAKFAEFKVPYTDEQFQHQLAERHTTANELKSDLRRSLTINKLLNKEINSKITISDAEIASYFNAHKNEFNHPDTQYHLAQILVIDNLSPQKTDAINYQNSKATNDDEARRKIQALKNRIDSGEDFGTLAMNFSENLTNSASGGDMGTLTETRLKETPRVFDAIEKLKPGQATDIIVIPDPNNPHKAQAYTILQLIDKEPAGQHDLSEPQVQQRIRQGLHDARSQLLKAAYFEMLRNQATIHNFFTERLFSTDPT